MDGPVRSSSPPGSWFPGYGVATVSTVAFLASAPGQTFIVSQLNVPLREEFGIGELELNGAYTLATVLAALPLVRVGRWTDRIGVRRMLVGTGFACGLGCLAMGAAQGLVSVFLGFFLLRFLAQGCLSLVSQHALAMWFHRRLGAMHGIKQVVVFTGWILAPQLAHQLIEMVGWRSAYAVFAVGVWLVVMPAAWLWVRDRPEDLGLAMDGDPPRPAAGEGEQVLPETTPLHVAPVVILEREPSFTLEEALRTRTFWSLAAAISLGPFVATALLFDIQPLLGARGLGALDAAFAVSAWSAAMALVALPAGMLTDRFAARVLLPVGLVLIVACCLTFLIADSRFEAALAMVLFGLGQGLVATTSVAALARTFGRAHHGAIRSSATRLAIIATGLGPFVTGLSAHLTGAYDAALWTFVVACLPVAWAAARLDPPRIRARA